MLDFKSVEERSRKEVDRMVRDFGSIVLEYKAMLIERNRVIEKLRKQIYLMDKELTRLTSVCTEAGIDPGGRP